jgi:hypothetical protein
MWSQNCDDCGLKDLVLQVATVNYKFLRPYCTHRNFLLSVASSDSCPGVRWYSPDRLISVALSTQLAGYSQVKDTYWK